MDVIQPPTGSPIEALWLIDAGTTLGKDYVPMANDIMRMVCIQLAIQVMLVLADPTGQTSLLSADFVLLVVYIALGVMLYWLTVRKLFVFV